MSKTPWNPARAGDLVQSDPAGHNWALDRVAAEHLRAVAPHLAATTTMGECSPGCEGCVPACGCVHDSPDFVPDAQRALEARGFERVNRHAPSPPPDAGAKCACGRWPVGVPCPVCTDDGPDGGGLPPAPEATGEMSREELEGTLWLLSDEKGRDGTGAREVRTILAAFDSLRTRARAAEYKAEARQANIVDTNRTLERVIREAEEARRMIAGVQPDDRAALAVNILRAWPRAEIETFARHLLGDREQESLLLGQLQTQLEIVTRERDEAREQLAKEREGGA